MTDAAFIQKISVNCDFSETGIQKACDQLGGVELSEVHVYVSLEYRNVARKLQAQYGFDLTLVPSVMLRAKDGKDHQRQDVWCVVHTRGIVWSPGCW